MGSAVSAGADNDELTDNLCKADYIRTARIERIFRAVDRGEYFLPEHRMNAYRDQAWRCNHLHLSAPCIYSEVLEGLSIAPGMSFLNLGSGTGYLSTLVGLILGSSGINHGVEYHEDVIQYANQKLEDFKHYSGAMDEFDFCEPKFMQGNCLCLTTDRRYDRVYVGAICPAPFDIHVKSLIKVGGILVMPFHDQLLQIRRDSEASWSSSSLLPVSFANLLLPKEDCKESFELMELQPDSLEKLCRTQIRSILRTNVERENPQLRRPAERPPKPAATPAASTTRRSKQQQHRVLVSAGDMFFSAATQATQGERMFAEDQRDLLRDFICNLNSAAQEVHTDDSDDDDLADVPMTLDKSTQVTTQSLSTTPGISGQSQEQPQRRPRDEKTEQPRRKFDSGLGDEEEMNDDELSSDSGQAQSKRTKLGWFNRLMKHTPDCMADMGVSGEASREQEREEMEQDPAPPANPTNGEIRTGGDEDDEDDDDDDEDEDDSDDYPEASCEDLEFYRKRRHVKSPYTALMCAKINELPLPSTLKNFLNYYRF